MTTSRTLRPALIAGHAAVAMLALAACHVAVPATPLPEWHVAGQLVSLTGQSPRRLPASRRAERVLTD